MRRAIPSHPPCFCCTDFQRYILHADVHIGELFRVFVQFKSGLEEGTFNPLFPRGAYFSETSLIRPANHIDVHPGIELKPAKEVTLSFDWDFFWRESTHDGIYGNAANLVRSGQTSDARYVGNQAQAYLEWQFARHYTFTVVYAHFFAGEFLKKTAPGKNVDYASIWMTLRF